MTLISGYIFADAAHKSDVFKKQFDVKTDGVKLDSKDVYKRFYDRGSYYK